jgi:hypothetical protein
MFKPNWIQNVQEPAHCEAKSLLVAGELRRRGLQLKKSKLGIKSCVELQQHD